MVQSGKYLCRCNFSRSTTLPAPSTLSQVGMMLIRVRKPRKSHVVQVYRSLLSKNHMYSTEMLTKQLINMLMLMNIDGGGGGWGGVVVRRRRIIEVGDHHGISNEVHWICGYPATDRTVAPPTKDFIVRIDMNIRKNGDANDLTSLDRSKRAPHEHKRSDIFEKFFNRVDRYLK